jgi:hypothetical protein
LENSKARMRYYAVISGIRRFVANFPTA